MLNAFFCYGPSSTQEHQQDGMMEEQMPGVGDAALDCTLPDHDNTPQSLAAFWRERPTILVWLRHFG